MKNLTNFGFVVLLLVVLGCNCDKIKQLANKDDGPSPSPAASSSPEKSPSSASSPKASSSSDAAGITQANYDRIDNGMSRKEVEDILGGAGERVSSSQIGKTKIESWKWAGKNYAFIFVNFTNDKVTFKSEANLK